MSWGGGGRGVYMVEGDGDGKAMRGECSARVGKQGSGAGETAHGSGDTARRTDGATEPGRGNGMEWLVLYYSRHGAAVGSARRAADCRRVRACAARVAHAPGSTTATRTTWGDGDHDVAGTGSGFRKHTAEPHRDVPVLDENRVRCYRIKGKGVRPLVD